jgi:uncharacterized protein (UPF0332 family)
MLGIHYNEAAGRTAYLAGFHAAQALISARTGRAVKTHGGVRTEFHRLVRGDPDLDDSLRDFLGATYNLKAIADYETGPGPISHRSGQRRPLRRPSGLSQRSPTCL